jgi:hypothetical protein
MRLPRPALPVLALALLAAAPLAAQERVVIYRCTGADGAVIVQNDRPCPSGTTQQDRRVIQAPQPAATPATPVTPSARPATSNAGTLSAPGTPGAPPARTPVGTAPTATATPPTAPATITVPPQTTGVPVPTALATVPGVAPTDDAAPPPLFECRVFDGTAYLGENPNPAPRCAPLATAGIGGTAPAAGEACQVVRDECAPVPAAALCDRWRQRLREMDSALTFGRLDERETARVEIDRVRSIVEDSACGS